MCWKGFGKNHRGANITATTALKWRRINMDRRVLSVVGQLKFKDCMNKILGGAAALWLCASLSGCAVVTVAGAAVSVAATAVKTTVKVGAGAVDLIIPDKKSEPQE
jgi:hypothetical protein